MAKQSPLTLAFLEQKPMAAGRALSDMSPEQAAALLNVVPTRSAVPALAAMGTWPAAAIIARMSTESAAAALRNLDYRDAAAILRNASLDVRGRLLKALPEKLQKDFETSLAFPDDTAGAHMSTVILTLTATHNAGDALDLLRRSKSPDADTVFVVDSERKLVGAVSAATLIRFPRDTVLHEIADRAISPVSARATLKSLEDLPAWSDYRALPVISRQGLVIGTLSGRTLTNGLDRQNPSSPLGNASLAASMLDAFHATVFGMTQMLAGGTQSAPRERKLS